MSGEMRFTALQTYEGMNFSMACKVRYFSEMYPEWEKVAKTLYGTKTHTTNYVTAIM